MLNMFYELHMGTELMTVTDAETVPHTRTAGYVPVYTLRDMDGNVIAEGPVDALIEQSHWILDVHGFYEDDYPVFYRG